MTNMRMQCCLSFGFVVLLCSCSLIVHGLEVEKRDMPDNPITTMAPPEGNTTFLGGTSWCVAAAAAQQDDLQIALDWTCGPGMADCSAIQPGGPCFVANNLAAVASYAFNMYYQANGNAPIACNFGGTATIAAVDPSYPGCQFPTNGNLKSSAMRTVDSFIRRWRIYAATAAVVLYYDLQGLLSAPYML